MRVVLQHKDFRPHGGGGGTARHIHGLAVALSGLGCEVRVAAPYPEQVTRPYETAHLASASAFRRHADWADVVHVHGARSVLALRCALAARARGKPFVYTPHCWYKARSRPNQLAKLLWDQMSERYLLSASASTILLAPFWIDDLRSRGLPSHRAVVIPNCVSSSELKVAARPPDPPPGNGHSPRILSVGRLSPEKRGRDVLAALAQPALHNAELRLVGLGADEPALRSLAARLGVADRVTFLGFVSDDAISGIVAGSDVFVLASEEEGLPTVLLEMIMARIPIVCTRIPGNLAITDRVGLQSTYDVGDIARLAELLSRPEASTVTDAMAAAVSRHFTWEARAADLHRLYVEALRHRHTH